MVDNKTVTRMLNGQELADYQPMFGNARKIRDLVNELQALSLELVEPTEASSTPKKTKATEATSGRTSRPRARKAAKPQG